MDLLITYALMHVGLPYKWGGDDPIQGYDCSGFVQELLISGGAHPDPRRDYTAQGLYDHYSEAGAWGKYVAGALAFYGRDARHISHVGFLLDERRIIDAGGGGSRTRNEEDAARHNAFIRVRPLEFRKDLRAVIRPDYSVIGVPY